MISVDLARQTILGHIRTLPGELVPLTATLGRYLSEDIVAGFAIPLWDNSAMDGYAVRLSDIAAIPARLPVSQVIPAGSTPRPLEPGSAARIMTGAPIPEGAEAVVMREDTDELGERVEIKRAPKKDENIRFKGEDISLGSVVLKRGTLIGPSQIGLLASLRLAQVPCTKRPVIAVLSTGDEVVDLDQPLTPGKIPSSNSYTLVSLVKELGAVPLYVGIARDNRADIESKLAAAAKADLILTSGGVSVGDFDLIKDVMTSKDNRMEFWQVAMKPGKPLAFGFTGTVPTIGLPGNPASAMVSFYQFARPAILTLLGASIPHLPSLKARLTIPIIKKGDRPHYIRGLLTGGEELRVQASGAQGSGILSSMAAANCFIVIPKEKELVQAGELVDCEVFGSIEPEDVSS
ncbi:MAG: gephyrin-like molybdotransferase Glp [Syntrophaceae bacterium]